MATVNGHEMYAVLLLWSREGQTEKVLSTLRTLRAQGDRGVEFLEHFDGAILDDLEPLDAKNVVHGTESLSEDERAQLTALRALLVQVRIVMGATS